MGYRIVGQRPFPAPVLAPSGYNRPLRTRVALPPQAPAYQVANFAQQGGPDVQIAQPTEGRVMVLGFTGTTDLADGASEDVTVRPQILFRPERIIIASAASWVLSDIKIGNKSQLVSNGNLPGAMFSADATGVELMLDTCNISQDFILSITNISGGVATFRAGVVGKAAY